MRTQNLELMDFEELWSLHEELTRVLTEKITAEKTELERRLTMLGRATGVSDLGGQLGDPHSGGAPLQRYPKVRPKFRNRSPPYETWSGRGKLPRWLVKELQAGRQLDDFKIETADEPSGLKTPNSKS